MNKQQQLVAAIGRLNLHHCFVLNSSIAGSVPVIEITSPHRQLQDKAVEVTEKRNGILSKVYVARFSGCIVKWRFGECQFAYGEPNSRRDTLGINSQKYCSASAQMHDAVAQYISKKEAIYG